ncbi:MAG: alpha-glucuronidase family glycosyl hydrolase [Bacteroidota bacterium]
MKTLFSKIIICFLVSLASESAHGQQYTEKTIFLVSAKQASPRISFGAEKLRTTLEQIGYKVVTGSQAPVSAQGPAIYIGELSNRSFFQKNHIPDSLLPLNIKKEGFSIRSYWSAVIITGADASGALYGCLELAERINANKKVPSSIHITDAPQMVMRGTCIGMQKSTYLPGREVYEYPYTPETFPWFYDKKLWIQYLDSMVGNRLNSLYLWNGHPFASLVRVKEYPYAVEVDSATFKKNEEIFGFLTHEADKRGIWVIQMFYNIIVSEPFAKYHHIKTQDRNRPIIPLIADYTRKSIAAFVEKYPNVGLMVALGEAMEGVGNDDIEWFTKTIIPGVKDGLKALGKTDEPPIVLRAHDTDAPAVIKAAKSLYGNLYTEAKFNGEALTWYEPRGKWADLHRTLSRSGSVQIENVHILANLEPFRYAASDFIQKSVQGMLNIYEANGLHLYPQASYWDWPYTADKTSPRLLQVERDWLWYKQWSRYAWNANRNEKDEFTYWSKLLAGKFGLDTEHGKYIQFAYNEAGEIAPKLLRRFGITDGNRQTLTLGMLMTQLINPYRFGLFDLMYDSESPEGEKLIEYAEKEWNHQKHIGETPVQIIKEVQEHGRKAVADIEKASPFVKQDKIEFTRIKNDMYCYRALADHYAQKAEAALLILRYKYSNDVHDLEKALPWLEQSIVSYKKLVKLTQSTYLYANSMQTQQRKIPIRGVNGTFKTWEEVLVPFEAELSHFKHKIDSLKTHPKAEKIIYTLKDASVQLTDAVNDFTLEKNAQPFIDTALLITDLAEELKGLKSLRLSFKQQVKSGTNISFTNTKPVKVLVGFFNKKEASLLKAPELETDAGANNFGQAETAIANGVVVKGVSSVNIHTYSFKPGKNTLTLAKGACLVLGFIDEDQRLHLYDAGLFETGSKREIDWLFE